jgi:UDP-N-acetylglucosamine--N-acetylmuramyl-(pentapeptide) pyrophosphoryl-undecaprenol N-acetylglucosamine transferase
VAQALRDRGHGASFASPAEGSGAPVVRRLLADAGFEVDEFRIGGIPREPSLRTVRALALAARAPAACAQILKRRRPAVVLGAGGYVAGPMVLAAGMLGIPAALTEADAHLGLANRLAAPFARRVFLAYALHGRDGSKYRVVGRPIPPRSRATDGREEARRLFDLPAAGPVLLVCGGSQGARALNEAAVDAFADEGPAVLHLSGARDHAQLATRIAREDYRLLPFTDSFGSALAAVDLVLSRSGGVVWEIAAAGKPAMLVPYPHATADHQAKNARYFERAGGAVLVREPLRNLREQVDVLLADSLRLARMSESMRVVARPHAADVIAEELIAIAARR